MRFAKTVARWNLAAVLAVLAISGFPVSLQAQSLGNNTVYNASNATTNSTAYIDASAFAKDANGPASASDLCTVLNYIYSTSGIIPSTGAVIDARGIAVGMSNPCTASPWNGVSSPPPTTVLLPPGGIFIPNTWVVPSGTHLIGERRNTNFGITSAFPTGNFMIQMGPSSPCSCPATGCAPVVVQDIALEPTATLDINGIDNECSGPLSYLDHIAFFDVAGIGLKIGPGAADSGPYTTLTYGAGSYCETNQPCPSRCVEIQAPTRGLHSMTCTMASTTTSTNKKDAAILLDANNNSIEGIHFEGFYDGVLVGDTASAAGSVLLHLTSGNGAGPVTNTVHICNPGNPASGTSCTSYTNNTPGDIAISQVVNNTNNSHLIQDDVTGTSVGIAPGLTKEYTAGLYTLGEVVGGGYSRFSTTTTTTSSQGTTPATPVWGVANLGSTTPATPCPIGSIFSNPGGTSGSSDTIFVCEFNSTGTATQWTGVK
jgi:hypothetical protein